ncbi:MAG: hypothetical protein JWL84_510 [Rhodospirillales bacterium]|jgi:hypothetical protein|nr:hypothetical protein [Rhodospirillales bacterium]
MEWTPENDAQLTELFKKRLGIRFISSWTRWPAPAIRLRLVELGLASPLSRRGAALVARAPQAASETAPLRQVRELAELEAMDDDDEDEGDLRASRGCPRGHLVSEAKIAALYRTVGRDYR